MITIGRSHKRELTASRRAELSEELADHVRQRARLLDHKKTWMKATNEAILSRETLALALARTLEHGYEVIDEELDTKD